MGRFFRRVLISGDSSWSRDSFLGTLLHCCLYYEEIGLTPMQVSRSSCVMTMSSFALGLMELSIVFADFELGVASGGIYSVSPSTFCNFTS